MDEDKVLDEVVEESKVDETTEEEVNTSEDDDPSPPEPETYEVIDYRFALVDNVDPPELDPQPLDESEGEDPVEDLVELEEVFESEDDTSEEAHNDSTEK